MGETVRTILLRRLGVLVAGTFALLSVGAVTAQAASPVVQETVPAEAALGGALPDVCNGQLIDYTGNIHLVGVMSTDAAGGAVFIGHVNLQNVHGTDATGNQYTIALDSNESIVFAPSSPNLPIPNVETHVIRLDIISNGATPNAYEDAVGHYTVTPDGQVAVYFQRIDTGCSG